jgi:hypothetical protein
VLKKNLHVDADWILRMARRGEEREAAVEEVEIADVEDLFTFAAENAREAGEGYEHEFVVSMI